MVRWQTFAAERPDLEEVGRALLEQYGVGLAFLATVRKDGGPRVHPVCPVFSGDGLYVLIGPTSPKHGDLVRDGRYALQSFPQSKPGSDELLVVGRATRVDDEAVRSAVRRDVKHMADPGETLFELWIERVQHTRWEDVLTPKMRSVHAKWRAPRS